MREANVHASDEQEEQAAVQIAGARTRAIPTSPLTRDEPAVLRTVPAASARRYVRC